MVRAITRNVSSANRIPCIHLQGDDHIHAIPAQLYVDSKDFIHAENGLVISRNFARHYFAGEF
ncbi:hypothetical protein ACX376_10620 [Sphingobium ummariense]